MNLFKAAISCLKKSFDFKTSSRRSEFWGFIVIAFLACFLLGFFDKLFFGASWPLKETLMLRDGEVVGRSYGVGTTYGPISQLCGLILLIPIISAAVRRLHDVGFRGWVLMLPVILAIPLAGLISSAVTSGKPSGLFPLLAMAFFLLLAFIIFLLFKDSDYPNKFGPSEKYPKAVSNPMFD